MGREILLHIHRWPMRSMPYCIVLNTCNVYDDDDDDGDGIVIRHIFCIAHVIVCVFVAAQHIFVLILNTDRSYCSRQKTKTVM